VIPDDYGPEEAGPPAVEQVRRLASVVSHEVRNAVAGVRGAIGIVGDHLPEASTDRAVIAMILARLDEVNERMEELSLFANPRPLALEPRRIQSVVAATAARFPAATVVVEGDDPTIAVDACQLGSALSQMIDNAARHDPGSRITIRCRALADCVEIDVSDGGPGVAPSLGPRSLEPFTTTDPERAGLGLAIASRVANAHGGDLRFEGGSTFVMRLPNDAR
jgi:signal transduction histidine kinase